MATATLTKKQRSFSRGTAHGVVKTNMRPVRVNQGDYNKKDKISSFVSESEMIDFISDIGAQYYGN